MLNNSDYKQIEKKGISKVQISNQLNAFVEGFPFLDIKSAATEKKRYLYS